MTEKTVQAENQLTKKERFEFVFTINGNIICQRYFRINGFKQKSLNSFELTESINFCADLIKKDLKEKSNIFIWYTSPKVFDNKDEMDNWVECGVHNLEVPSYIILRDSDDTYVWNGESAEKYEGYFNKSDYLGNAETDTPCILKLAFLDNGKEVISTAWNGNIYPRFVRTNIDLSNSKNKYEGGNIFAPFESSLIKLMTKGQHDLIPQIVKEICLCCSHEDDKDYTNIVKYGEKTYNFNTYGSWLHYVNTLEPKLKKKTESYLKRWS